TVKQIIQTGGAVKGSKVIVLGLTFKENCADLRNSKVADLVRELQEFGCEVSVHDPLAEPKEAMHEYGILLTEWNALPGKVDAIVAAVSHTEYTGKPVTELLSRLKMGGVFIDVKSTYPQEAIEAAGYKLWRL
ncbi:MAG: UDP binding domain-containing protein, partial [Cellvibrio sp.]|uniref:UDP binding domain-containing protein n=1 Tax=Cellvibrio sp. TaxID=1965322 RepID=UPI0027228808|nr:UDP binding domain-containing protein [Cellvibrio sp.]